MEAQQITASEPPAKPTRNSSLRKQVPPPPTPSRERALSSGWSLNSNMNFYDIPVSNALNDLIEQYLPPNERPQIGAEKDTKELKTMVTSNMWRSLAKYARQQIVQSESSQVESILELWYLRLLALTKLGLCQLASAEFEKLGDFERPELCDPNTQESLVPFELRVLFATLPVHLKYPTVALERITLLIVYCKRMQIKKNKATSSNSNKGDNGDIWEQRELQMYLVLATHLVHMKDFTAAAEVLSRVSKRAPDDLDILYSLGQLYLQMGDLKSASKVFQQAQNKYNNASNNDEQMGSSSEMKATDINKTFESIAQGNWSKARDSLETMNQHNDNPTMVNNLAVCELYLGNLSKAIKIIEDLILKHPASAGICETTLMNLCTLYELRYENSNQKKLELLKQVAAWVGDSFQPTCLKLQ